MAKEKLKCPKCDKTLYYYERLNEAKNIPSKAVEALFTLKSEYEVFKCNACDVLHVVALKREVVNSMEMKK